MTTECLTKPFQALPTDLLSLEIVSPFEPLPLNYRVVLQAVEQLSVTIAPGSWAALNQDAYFGQGTADLCFKEMLLPFVWVARQQLIARVGARYQTVAMPSRAGLERELLATLNTLCLQGIRLAYQGLPLLQIRSITDDYCRRGWRGFYLEHPQLAKDLAETLAAWVDSMVRLLDGSGPSSHLGRY